MAENNFETRIHNEKISRLNKHEWMQEYDQKAMIEFFDKNGISIDSFREFFKSKGKNDHAIESMFTNLNFKEWKEKIFAEILEKWPIKTPSDLAVVIAEYIKSHMKYDTFSLLNQINNLSKYIDKGVVDEKLLFLLLNQMGMSFSQDEQKKIIEARKDGGSGEQFLQEMTLKIQNNNDYRIDDGMLQLFTNIMKKVPENVLQENSILLDLKKLSEEKDIDGFRKRFFDAYIHDANNFRSSMYEAERMMWWYQSREVYDMLKNVHNGVCRHFSVMMKEMYNEFASRLWFKDTEMLLVGNMDHAYNLLIEDWNDGELKKQYFDITNFVSWQDLIWKRQGMDDKNELWVKNALSQSQFV